MPRQILKKIRMRLSRVLKSSHARHAGLITFGTIAAQVVLLISTPILSRLYSPADFGFLGLLVSIGTIAGAGITLCWQFLILNMRRSGLSVASYHLALYSSVVGAVTIGLGVAIIGQFAPGISLTGRAWVDALLISGTTLTMAAFTVLGYPLARHDRFRAVALSKFMLSALPATAQIALSLFGLGGLGLLVGRAVGQIGVVLLMMRDLPEQFRFSGLFKPRKRALRFILKRHSSVMLHTPRVLLVRGMSTAPVLFILWYFGPVASGLYFFMERLIERPGFLLADALSRLPHKVFAEKVRQRQPVLRLIIGYTMAASVLVVPAIAILVWLGPSFFAFVFGGPWADAAAFAVPIALNAALRLTVMPAISMVNVLDLARISLAIEMVFLARISIFPLVAFFGGTALDAVWAYTAANLAYHTLQAALALYYSRRYERSLA